MTANGKDILGFVQEIRRFCGQLADLLGSADKLMATDGWELATSSNVAYANPSSSLEKPAKWFPQEVFRFYRNTDNPRALAMVSVLLDSDRKGEYQLVEPLVCGGWFEFATQAPFPASDRWWWSRFHAYMPERRDDGSLNTVSPKTAWPAEYREDWYPFEKVTTIGLPLVGLTDTGSLDGRIVKPLLRALRESSVAAGPTTA